MKNMNFHDESSYKFNYEDILCSSLDNEDLISLEVFLMSVLRRVLRSRPCDRGFVYHISLGLTRFRQQNSYLHSPWSFTVRHH